MTETTAGRWMPMSASEECQSEDSSGTDQNLETYFLQYRRDVFRIALSVLGPGSEADAEDVCQDVLLRTHRKLGRVRSEAALRSWLYRSTVNAAISSRRRLRWRAPHLAPTEQDVGSNPPANPLHVSARQLVRRLPPHERTTVHLHYWFGFTTREIAAMTGGSDATVRSRLFRARRRLAAWMDDGGNDESVR